MSFVLLIYNFIYCFYRKSIMHFIRIIYIIRISVPHIFKDCTYITRLLSFHKITVKCLYKPYYCTSNILNHNFLLWFNWKACFRPKIMKTANHLLTFWVGSTGNFLCYWPSIMRSRGLKVGHQTDENFRMVTEISWR